MEIVDELMTPGCPNCFVKHMSAALARMVASRRPSVQIHKQLADRYLLARALINLTEAFTGYTSHFDYAVGLMVLAEECATANGDFVSVEDSRKIRVRLVVERFPGIPEAVAAIKDIVSTEDLVVAHILEAFREMPTKDEFKEEFTVDGLRAMIAEIRKEYFEIPEEGTEEGKEVK